MGDLLPAFTEGSPGPHPGTGQQDLGITLDTVHPHHPDPDEPTAILKALNVDHLAKVSLGSPALSFPVKAPEGVATLD